MSEIEQPKSVVVSMEQFLTRRYSELVAERNRILAQAQKISKHADPSKDPFASVLVKKADSMVDPINSIVCHLNYIKNTEALKAPPMPPSPPTAAPLRWDYSNPSVTIQTTGLPNN